MDRNDRSNPTMIPHRDRVTTADFAKMATATRHERSSKMTNPPSTSWPPVAMASEWQADHQAPQERRPVYASEYTQGVSTRCKVVTLLQSANGLRST